MVNKENYEEYMLLYADGELNEQEQQALLQYVHLHPELQTELDAYMATVLIPDNTISYAGKEALMQPQAKGRTIFFGGWKTYAAVASVAALIALFFFTRSEEDINNNRVADAPQTIQNPIDNTQKINNQETNTVAQNSDNNSQETNDETQQPDHKTIKPNNKQTITSPVPANSIAQKTDNNSNTEQQTNNTTNRQHANVVVVETTPVKQIAGNISPQVATVDHQNTVATTTTKPINKTVRVPITNKVELTPIISDNIALLNTMEQAVVQKIDKAKQVAHDLRGSDVILKLGKKEILIVKL